MKLNCPLQSKEIKERVIKNRFAFASFVLMLAFVFFAFNFVKVDAAGVSETIKISGVESNVNVVINGTKYEKYTNKDNSNLLSAVELTGATDTNKETPLIFIQSNGVSKDVEIHFTITNFPSNATAFMIVESQYTDSSSNPDADRYNYESTYVQAVGTGSYLKIGNLYYEITSDNTYADASCTTLASDATEITYLKYRNSKCSEITADNRYSKTGDKGWVGSATNDESGNITVGENGSVKVVYRLRTAGFGLKYFKLVFYEAHISDSSPSDNMDVHFVVSKPIDSVSLSHTNAADACKTNDSEICIEYSNEGTTRESQPLKLYIPSSVAFDYKTVSKNDALSKYNDTSVSTIYAINYFTEVTTDTTFEGVTYRAGETIADYRNKATATAKYLYTNFEKGACNLNNATLGDDCDTQEVTDWLVKPQQNANYGNYLNQTANTLTSIDMEVDASGAYFFYITDIFGNVTETIYQEVTNVKNRSIETIVKKGNAKVEGTAGYNAEEDFTNQSVKVTLDMKVKTNYEFGQCMNNMCTTETILNSSNVSKIQFWRVDVEIDETYGDKDAYDEGDTTSEHEEQNQYASKSYAAGGNIYDLYCLSNCTTTDYSNANSGNENGYGAVGFEGNTFVMYVALSGRYRFYIEDTAGSGNNPGNNTWGSDGDLMVGEYRNPRVEVYAIDKAAPEITFDHLGEEGNRTKFDIETYEYYRGIDVVANESGKFVYDASSDKDAEAESKEISSTIYYEVNRDKKDALDTDFTDNLAISLSKVIVSDKLKGYSVNDDKVYAQFKGVDSSYVSGNVANDITTIKSNIKNNSNGLKLNGNDFEFESIEYFHNDGTLSVCEQIKTSAGEELYNSIITGVSGDKAIELRCVNYYIDHGVDFIIRFTAQDSLGNQSSGEVYVNVVDTTPAGFNDQTNKIKATNIIEGKTTCRMEVGQTIGVGKTQTAATILDCYNVSVEGDYKFEDNVYKESEKNGLKFFNRINSLDYVDLYIYDDSETQIDLKTKTFTPNRTGYYDLDIVINDGNGNSLTVKVSYYVDKKIVLIAPIANEKYYGQNDTTFDYCVYIDTGNHTNERFSSDPYSNIDIFTPVYCTKETNSVSGSEADVLGANASTSSFTGALSRIESSWYNKVLNNTLTYTNEGGEEVTVGVENNYVGNYNLILGNLNITVDSNGAKDDNYIVKIHKTYRTDYIYQTKDKVMITEANKESIGSNSINDAPLDDDDTFAQSNVMFTIKQILLEVNANGGSKSYGEVDTNKDNYNDDDASDKYLSGYTVNSDTLINDGVQYTDTTNIVLGVLRREVGENVGLYSICNYRGDINDSVADTYDMLVGCEVVDPEIEFAETVTDYDSYDYTYENGILKMNGAYIKSRALYVATNKSVAGRTMNSTEDARNNTRANYVIKYTGAKYKIDPIDLIVQAAPGQRREYNANTSYSTDPNPWEIILYGLKESYKVATSGFNGYTASASDYSATIKTLNVCGEITDIDDATTESCYQALLATNQSENRDNWYFMNGEDKLSGLKTNESYSLLRNVTSNSEAGSGKLVREEGRDGGWYDYYSLANDIQVGATASNEGSTLAVITNGMDNCVYDSTGHLFTVSEDGESLCKNYELKYNAYYTDINGFRYDNKEAEKEDSNYIYKSTGLSSEFTCMNLDPDLPCYSSSIDGEDSEKQYRITFEIYRREIILEFNSGIENIKVWNATDEEINLEEVMYGKRYGFYNTNYFSMEYYYSDNTTLKGDSIGGITPEDYLFYCYQDMSWTDSGYDEGNPTGTGCTGNPRYGLTDGDTWKKIGLAFKLHDSVSGGYTSESGKAIPAGVYFVYASIAEAQTRNYNFKYQGGTLTIKSKPVDIAITSYMKEYGEPNYSKYGDGTDFSDMPENCVFDDSNIISGESETTLISVSCMDENNGISNKYAFYIANNGLDEVDSIKDNFKGRPDRDRSVSLSTDTNGLQDNVGIYKITKGTIQASNVNPFLANSSCALTATPESTCVVVSGNAYQIENYVTLGEEREYVYDLVGTSNDKSVVYHSGEIKNEDKEEKHSYIDLKDLASVTEGSLFITPATLTITVTSNQTKMFGCAYNQYALTPSYTYGGGYANCVDDDGDYYDLGYRYLVSGDKDYQIANNGFNYSSDDSYTVDGNSRPSTIGEGNGIKAHALNDGVLYRVARNTTNEGLVKNNQFGFVTNANASGGKTQGQTVGNYIITLGSVNATENQSGATYKNTCDSSNNPTVGGTSACRNYNINYYNEQLSKYDGTEDNPFPTDLLFSISSRTVYMYTDYDSKVYGEADPEIEYTCTETDVTNRLCASTGEEINFGITKYYAKVNSLAKAPWNGEDTTSDYQTKVVTGKISRKGMGENNPATDDVKGYYEYRYADKGGTVALTEYGLSNYEINFYEKDNDDNELAVNAAGEFESQITVDEVTDTYPVKFEIVLRRIKIKFISFNKIYGESDVVTDYDILVCAPSQEFVQNANGTWKCGEADPNERHGLSATHKEEYINEGGDNWLSDAKLEKFKTDFMVRYKRVLGENVSCGTSDSITVKLTGNFFGTGIVEGSDGTEFEVTLQCKQETIDEEQKKVYQTLAYIDQSLSTLPGYNYEASYEIGYVNIIPRPIVITPDANQGFEYGNYHGSLIPAITFADGVKEDVGAVKTYGLVNNGADGGVCLKNIDYYNNGADAGTCFVINDRQNEYDAYSGMTTSYTNPTINTKYGIASVAGDGTVTYDYNKKNYVFEDVYATESSTRTALNRTLNSDTDARYNRNVGEYTITLGELGTKTFANYTIELTTSANNLKYEITAADVSVTPVSDQSKIYGEADEELKFEVITEYDVKETYYLKWNEYITHVYDFDEVLSEWKDKTAHTKNMYNWNGSSFVEATYGSFTYILIEKGDKIRLKGFAYSENTGDPSLNYGLNKDGQKLVGEELAQASVTGAKFYDKYCRGIQSGTECNENVITYLNSYKTTRILLGYVFVSGYNQSAGVYSIKNGFKVANNEFGNKNYNLTVNEEVEYTIIPRPVGVNVNDLTKTYGEATDNSSCDEATGCEGIIDSIFTYFTVLGNEANQLQLKDTGIDSILGTNKDLYMNGENLINGLPIAYASKYYTPSGSAEGNGALKVYVSRDELNANGSCMYANDPNGMCEDVGTYALRLYGYGNTIDTLEYRPAQETLVATSSVSSYYYNMYFDYNPNYFVVVIDKNNKAVTSSNLKETENQITTARDNTVTTELLKSTGVLTIDKKEVAIYVNTHFIDNATQTEIYYIEQNTNPPVLPGLDNESNLDYVTFTTNRAEAVGTSTYGNAIWGNHNTGVRTGDKLDGQLAYCNTILTEAEFKNNLLTPGITASNTYDCSDLLYDSDKNDLNTNLPGYVPIIRDITKLSIVNTSTVADGTYESANYDVTFYPGALRIEIDDTKPVVEVNRSDVYIEANAVGQYSYDCVGKTGTTTYSDCEGLNIIGSMDQEAEDAILKWLKTDGRDVINTISEGNTVSVIAGALPKIENCDSTEYECTASALFQLMYGKGNANFNSNGGIKTGEEATHVSPFTIQTATVDNSTPHTRNELINSFVNWFGVTAYDLGEIRNGQALNKVFDKYWFMIIENLGVDSEGTEVQFEINKVGSYRVHFYVMDNAGNVSQGNSKEAYYEIKVSNRYNLVNGNYIQDNAGNYLKVASYLQIVKENLYDKDESGNYTQNDEGRYLLSSGNYYDTYAYKRFEKTGNDYILNNEGDYLELHASYYSIANDKVYTKNGDGSYTASGTVANGSYLRVGADYNNTATLHIIDTTAPTVGTLNLYNGKVSCNEGDCSKEENWLVAQDTFVPINTLLRYNSDGTDYSGTGDEYVEIGSGSLVKLSTLTKYDVNKVAITNNVVAGAKYIKIIGVLDANGNAKATAETPAKAIALKHYTWTNQDIYLTITGGSDNSYTDSASRQGIDTDDWAIDNSQWDHYYSRDGGITWFLYSRTGSGGILALAQEGRREIMIKAVDKGVKLTSDKSAGDYEGTKSYIDKFYGVGNENNTTGTKTIYKFTDSSADNKFLYELESANVSDMTEEIVDKRYSVITSDNFGWNVSDAAEEDKGQANKISKLIYGIKANEEQGDPADTEYSGYTYYRDKKYAYYDITKPVVSIGGSNGEKLYLFEYGCSTLDSCKKGYTEYYATVGDTLGRTNRDSQNSDDDIELSTSILIDKKLQGNASQYEDFVEGIYTILVNETLNTEEFHSGLSDKRYSMQGTNAQTSIQNIYQEDRIYVIYEFKDGSNTRVDYDRSATMTNDVIPSTTEDYSGGDVTYTVVYSVVDKAGNESQYIARGVIFADLVPYIEVNQSEVETVNALEQIDDQTYYLNVEQGTDVKDIVRSLSVDANVKSSYLTQTVYYNGELVLDNVRYNPNVYDGFNTDNPGVYEITYNLQYRYYGENGESEMISAEPLKLVVNVESTAPISESSNSVNYQNIILLISLLAGAMFIVMLGVLGKKRI